MSNQCKFLLLVLLCTFVFGKCEIEDIIETDKRLSKFSSLLKKQGFHRAFLERPITIFAVINEAFSSYPFEEINENLILNHMINLPIEVENFNEGLSSLLTGNPVLWIRKTNNNTFYVNHAKIIESNIRGKSFSQIYHIIDSFLVPLTPISNQNPEYFNNIDARKLLSKSSLYHLNGYSMTTFYNQAVLNRKAGMFSVPGRHTFFFPIDEAFDNESLSSYNRNNPLLSSSNKVKKSLVDGRVLEGHIAPDVLLFTNSESKTEFPTVAWLPNGIQVTLSIERSSDNNTQVKSNTIVGDKTHHRGLVIAKIIKGNIPVSNGVVHLIDKPLIIVQNTLYEYLITQGQNPKNRLSEFSALLQDKGGRFIDALLEADNGTFLIPSNKAMNAVNRSKLDYIFGTDYLRFELLGLHFIRQRLLSTDTILLRHGERTFSVPASLANNRIWFQNYGGTFSCETRGVNATIIERDIGTTNGVIHIIDRVLGVPYQSLAQKLNSDPLLSKTNYFFKQLQMDRMFFEDSNLEFTLIVPTNAAWERAQLKYPEVYSTLMDGQFPRYTRAVMERHIKIKGSSLEELSEITRASPRRSVDMIGSSIEFSRQDDYNLRAYKDNFLSWNEVKGQIIRPNIECTNGYIHVVDTVLLDESSPMTNEISKSVSQVEMSSLLIHIIGLDCFFLLLS